MAVADTADPHRQVRTALLAAAFVPIWSTGFILARLVAPHAEPLTFLAVRFAVACLLLALVAVWKGAAWPQGLRQWGGALMAGMLIHGIYLGGVFWAVAHGLPTAISALVAGLQPLLIGILARPLLGEAVSRMRWAGIAIGALGASVTLAPKLGVAGEGGIPPVPLLVCMAGVVSITLGTIWQKRQSRAADLTSGTAVQYAGALVPILLVLSVTGWGAYDVTSLALWAGLAWAVLGLSIGAILLLFILIRQGAVAKVSSLLYLVPGVSAVMAWVSFGETLTLVQIAGLLVAAVGVAAANRG